ncbi:hypothetical protein GOODEAATRI_030593 [Goodea atripinnis]|uniref:Uncharacterized protein n=1 Tax=Goodea atripinnis TaxID=208336 RepID=A0ABV0Q353_9TELE
MIARPVTAIRARSRKPAETVESSSIAGGNVTYTPIAARPGAVVRVTNAPETSSPEQGPFSDPSQEASGEAPAAPAESQNQIKTQGK